MIDKNKKILVAMSGGVDSSVVSALLVDQGYDVTGAYMINYDTKDHEGMNVHGEACWVPDYRDAVRVAAKLGIPLLKLNFQKEYKEGVLDYMYAEYKKGRTPNPDVMCNRVVKFGAWLDKAKELGFEKIATGHYAQVVKSQHQGISVSLKSKVKSYELRMAKDDNKDQTYFLHQLNQDQLAHAMFSLGEYTKDEVRKLAKKFDLPTAEKEESMGICFVGEVSMTDFLKREIKPTPGNIVMSESGEVVGEHEGLAFYTIGQRHFGQGTRNKEQVTKNKKDVKPLFIAEKRFDKNELVVGYEDDELLWKVEVDVENMHWIRGQKPEFPLQCEVRMRHRQTLQNVQCSMQNDQLHIIFEAKQKAVTPGQFAVLYKDGECLGGGVVI